MLEGCFVFFEFGTQPACACGVHIPAHDVHVCQHLTTAFPFDIFRHLLHSIAAVAGYLLYMFCTLYALASALLGWPRVQGPGWR